MTKPPTPSTPLEPTGQEPAREEVRTLVEELLAEADRVYEEAPYFCNKCGFFGPLDPPGLHPGPCRYLAAKSGTGWQIYNALEPLRAAFPEARHG